MIQFNPVNQTAAKKQHFRPAGLQIALLCCALAVASPCGAQTPTQVVRLLVPPSNSSLPLLLLARTDPIPSVDIQAQLYLNHPQALAALLRGEADLLLTGTSQGWENYLSGSPILMIDTGVWGISWLIGSKDCPPINSIAELAGRRIALPFPGSPLDFQTRFLLHYSGLDPDRDCSILYAPLPQTAALLLKGQIDAAPVPEPLATELVLHRGMQRFLDYRQAWASTRGGDPLSPQVSLFTTRNFASANSELLQALVLQWREASEQVLEDPEEIAARFSALLDYSEEVIALSIPNTSFYVPSLEENRDRVQIYYQIVKRYLPGKRGELAEEFFFLP